MNRIEVDIAIVGMGSAGIGAVLAGMANNKSILVIEKNNVIGGKATVSAAGTICGLYLQSSDNKKHEAVHKGAIMDFVQNVMQKSDSKVLTNDRGLKFVPYDIEVFKEHGLALTQHAKVNLLTESELIKVNSSDGSIHQLDVMQNGKTIQIMASEVIDASGNAIVSQLADQPMIEDDHQQTTAIVFGVSGLSDIQEITIDLAIKRLALKMPDSPMKEYILGTSVVPGSLRDHKALFKLGIPINVNADRSNLEEIAGNARTMIDEVVEHLKKELTILDSIKVEFVADELGDRTGKRPEGSYVLTKHDVLSGKYFEDTVAIGTWAIEIWREGHRVEMKCLGNGKSYGIPYGCLSSSGLKNLTMAGRCISAEFYAIASARVIGTCLATGFAAGEIASGRIDGKSKEEILNNINKNLLSHIPVAS